MSNKLCFRCSQAIAALPFVLESQPSGIGYRKRHLECPPPIVAAVPAPLPEAIPEAIAAAEAAETAEVAAVTEPEPSAVPRRRSKRPEPAT